MSEHLSPHHFDLYAENPGHIEHARRLARLTRSIGKRALDSTHLDRELRRLPTAEQERQRQLDQFVVSILRNIGPPQSTRQIPGRLLHGGINTVRDVLVLGRLRTCLTAGPHLPPRQNETLREALSIAHPDISFPEKPSAEHAAQFCHHLSQVHAGVLDEYFRRPIIGPHYEGRARLTVAEILQGTPEIRPRSEPRHGFNPARLLDQATEFAEAFTRARRATK